MIRTRSASVFAFCLIPFIVLATLNSGGYRYGASDQAFYQPAVLKRLDPALFPRDTVVLTAQTRLTAADEVMAAAVRVSGLSVPSAFALLYLVALSLFAWGVWLIGNRFYVERWTVVALLAAVSLRHGIARSGTNSLEGYFQPRLLAYALGALAIAAFLRGRLAGVAALIALAAAVHPTTAVWFAVWLGAAAAIAHPRLRRSVVLAGCGAAALGAWLLFAGPLRGRLVPMDPEWLHTLAGKDYLFPLQWPAYAWALNLGYLVVIGWLHRMRRRAGLADRLERALVSGSLVLAGIFALALIAHQFRLALAIQLQPARVFWMFDLLAVMHMVWWIAEGRSRHQGAGTPVRSRAAGAAAMIAAFSLVRGLYVVYEADRPAVQLVVPDDDWGRVMAWARTTDRGAGFLADPMHAVWYGTSLRVAGERDVLVESVKDAAIGMYDRGIAMRTAERIAAVPSFDSLTTDEARRLGRRYDLQYIVTEMPLDLPLAFESGTLRIYRLQ